MALASAGLRPDGYDLETSTILPRLSRARSVEDVRGIAEEEIGRWFDDEFAGDPAIAAAAEEIWEAWNGSPLGGSSAPRGSIEH